MTTGKSNQEKMAEYIVKLERQNYDLTRQLKEANEANEECKQMRDITRQIEYDFFKLKDQFETVESFNKILQKDSNRFIKEKAVLTSELIDIKEKYHEQKKQIDSLRKTNLEISKMYNELLPKYDELKKSYKTGCIFSIKDGKVFDRSVAENEIEQMFEEWKNKSDEEKGLVIIYKNLLNKLYNSKDGFLYQTFIDYDTLNYCYHTFIQYGFDVHQLGDDTLIIRNK